MKKYYTGILVYNYEKPSRTYGSGWYVDVEDYDKYDSQKEIVIYAKSQTRAQNSFELIICSIHILLHPPFGLELEYVIPADPDEHAEFASWFAHPPENRSYAGASNFWKAVQLACKASRRLIHQYALAKYMLATESCSVAMVDLDPSYSDQHLGICNLVLQHTRFAQAIVQAYSVIEELGLEIRASGKNPSIIKGKWNPRVLENLEERLRQANVDLTTPILWIQRGSPTAITKAKDYCKAVGRYSFSIGPYVNDKPVKITDAILQASFLRSKVSSHKSNRLTKSLTPYDVENVKSLARILFLSKLGFLPTCH